MNKLKKFQEDTVEAAWNRLKPGKAARRFLVADEVGLGKTLVAQQIVRKFVDYQSPKPAVVLYVCGSLPLASQNSEKLLQALDDPAERKRAKAVVDRLTMVPMSLRPPTSNKLNLYALTPATSLPQEKGPQQGRKEERALLQALTEGIGRELAQSLGSETFRGAVHEDNFRSALRTARDTVTPAWQQRFVTAVREEWRLEKGSWILPALLKEFENASNRKLLLKRLRLALAVAVLGYLSPDLVIFDEFHGYADRLTSGAEGILVKTLRGEEGEQRPAVMLLSATPYRMRLSPGEDPSGVDHQNRLFELLEYLFGKDRLGLQAVGSCKLSFRDLHKELQAGLPDSESAIACRDNLENELCVVLSRTERGVQEGTARKERVVSTPIQVSDVHAFKAFAKNVGAYKSRRDMADLVSYWASIPLPMQTMGRIYKMGRGLKGSIPKGSPQLRVGADGRLHPLDPIPHPRLRALSEQATARQLAVPWIGPSLAWWKLGGHWSAQGKPLRTKLLVFGHYRATPLAVAALLSYGVETAFPNLRNKSGAAVANKRYLRVSRDYGLSLVAAFHPSPWLTEHANPSAVLNSFGPGTCSRMEVEKIVISQLRRALHDQNIPVQRKGTPRPIWKLLAKLEAHEDHTHAWTDYGAVMERIGQRWRREGHDSLQAVTERELRALARHALCAPGVALGRAVLRHDPETLYNAIFKVAWNGLRSCLDRPWFSAGLRRRGQGFLDAIYGAVFDGNLESVLDEHLWLERALEPGMQPGELIKKLTRAVRRVGSRVSFRKVRHPLRCHVSIPFTAEQVAKKDSRQQQDESRPDEIRHAFNSPFWPHVLTTTSVGQEGLDFHYWCRTVVHWDLSSNPVESEQREGRVQRFGGLNVRQAIASAAIATGIHWNQDRSPWTQIADWIEGQGVNDDESGLSPWWVYKGSETECLVFMTPGSGQKSRYDLLQRRRRVYRLTLGQPNQSDLMDLLARDKSLTLDRIAKAVLRLSAYDRNKRKERVVEAGNSVGLLKGQR